MAEIALGGSFRLASTFGWHVKFEDVIMIAWEALRRKNEGFSSV